MKLYVAAIIAFAPLQNLDDKREDSLAYTLPGLIAAEDIDTAAEQCRQRAFDRWKPEDGWYGHHAEILPITKSFVDQVLAMRLAGVLDLTPEGFEDGRSYTF